MAIILFPNIENMEWNLRLRYDVFLCMQLTRRSTVMGAGLVVTGVGGAIGSGAFTQVKAERTANVAVTDDSQAYLRILTDADENDTSPYDSFNNQSYVEKSTGQQGQNVVQFRFDEAGGGTDGNGLNDNAVTTFENVFMLENQSGGTVDVDYEITDSDSNTNSADVVTLYDDVGSGSELSAHSLGDGDYQYVDFGFDTTVGSVASSVSVKIIANSA